MSLPGLKDSLKEMEEIKKMGKPGAARVEVMDESVEHFLSDPTPSMKVWSQLQNELTKLRVLKQKIRETMAKIETLLEEI